jgi:hypothetical protein
LADEPCTLLGDGMCETRNGILRNPTSCYVLIAKDGKSREMHVAANHGATVIRCEVFTSLHDCGHQKHDDESEHHQKNQKPVGRGKCTILRY